MLAAVGSSRGRLRGTDRTTAVYGLCKGRVVPGQGAEMTERWRAGDIDASPVDPAVLPEFTGAI